MTGDTASQSSSQNGDGASNSRIQTCALQGGVGYWDDTTGELVLEIPDGGATPGDNGAHDDDDEDSNSENWNGNDYPDDDDNDSYFDDDDFDHDDDPQDSTFRHYPVQFSSHNL
jgi:hypothetical protein